VATGGSVCRGQHFEAKLCLTIIYLFIGLGAVGRCGARGESSSSRQSVIPENHHCGYRCTHTVASRPSKNSFVAFASKPK
jgi:hypothetical protein